MRLNVILKQARACTLCEAHLPLGPRPLLQGSADSCVLIIGQAPGKAAHESGVPWDDKSGERLRDWLGVDDETFYDGSRVALLPMGFCYPGKGKSGDMPPRPECAPEWHEKLLAGFSGVRLTVYVGKYPVERYLSDRYPTLTGAVEDHARLLPRRIALPHPSPRNNIWLKKHEWFERETLPALRKRVRGVLRAK